MISLSELLAARGFVPDPKHVKLVRHSDKSVDLEALRNARVDEHPDDSWLDVYQRYQERPSFNGCTEIVVFLGEQSGISRFIGIYDVGEYRPAAAVPLPAACPNPEWARRIRCSPTGAEAVHFYQLHKRHGFEDLEDRLVIDWKARSFHLWFRELEVIEVRPRGRALPAFRDYLRVHLSYDDLVKLADQPDAHRDWVAGLSAVGAIYLVVASHHGDQYVGSATGDGGLWQRWCVYANNGHGNNQRLRQLCEGDPRYPGALRFSILETFSRSLSQAEALSLEAFFKKKLGSRAYGLNAN